MGNLFLFCLGSRFIMEGPPQDAPPSYDQLTPMREELVNGRGNDSQPLLDGPPSDAPPTYSSIDVPAAADRGAGNPPGQYYYAAPPAGAPPPNDAPPTYNSAEVQGLQGSGNFDPTLGQGQHQSFDYSKAAPVDYG